MCPFYFQKKTYWKSFSRLSNVSSQNEMERMEIMNKEIQIFSDKKIIEIGKRIKEKRKEKGYKAIDFADIIGVGKDQLSRIENGKLPCKTEYLFIMSQVLEVSVDYLMFGSNNEDEELISLISRIPVTLRKKAKKILSVLAEE